MQRDTQHLSELVHQIYDASIHPERWNQVVAVIAASFGSTQAMLLTPNLGPQHGGLFFPAGIEESYLQLYASHYIDKNVWAIGMQKRGLWHEGQAYLGDEMVSREEFWASPFYREFLSVQNTETVCAGIVFAGSADFPATALSVFRGIADAPFDQDDVEWMKLLTGHVSRSLGLMMRLDTARVQNASLLASHDRLNFGVALLNENMQVLHLNQAAHVVMNRADGIFINAQQQLECLSVTERLHNPEQRKSQDRRNGKLPSLSRWLMAVRDTPISDPQHFLDGYVVARKNGGGENKQCYVLQCAPVPVEGAWRVGDQGDKIVRFVVFVTDPQAVQLPDATQLCAIYDLTPAQAKVACEFASGGTYKQVAQRLQVSEETVRAHIKEIYPKTRVNRQADLVRLVLSIGKSGV